MSIDLQNRIGFWHQRRFPNSEPYMTTMKAMAELGEVADAVNGVINIADPTEPVIATWDDVAEEAADVVICMMALVARWCPDADLTYLVERKLAVLNDPRSGHRSAIQGGGR